MWNNFLADIQNNWFKDYGSIIGNIITIALFIIAFYKDKGKERKKQEKIKTEKLRYLASLINSSIKTAESNRDSVQDTSDEFKKDPAKFHLIKWDTYYDIKRIVEKLDLEEYYLAYVTQFENRKDTTVNYQKIITCLDTLFQMFNELVNQAQRASINDFDRKKKLKTLSDEIDYLIKRVLYLVEVLQMPESFKVELQEPIDKWREEKNRSDVQLFLDILCAPMYEIISKFNFQKQQQIPPEFILLLEKFGKVKIEVEFIKSGNIEYAESLNKQFIEIDKTITTLKTNSKQLREYLENTDN